MATRDVQFQSLRASLARMGFVQPRKSDETFLLDLDSPGNTFGWLAFMVVSKRTAPGCFQIDPNVGILQSDAKALIADCLAGAKGPTPAGGATMWTPMGYLCSPPAFRSWDFGPDPEVNANSSAELACVVQDVALPFMRQHQDLRAILDALVRRRLGTNLEYQRPAIMYLLGMGSETLGFLAEQVASIGERTDLAAECYRLFARNLTARIRRGY